MFSWRRDQGFVINIKVKADVTIENVSGYCSSTGY